MTSSFPRWPNLDPHRSRQQIRRRVRTAKADRLVMDKWFGLQVIESDPEDAHEVVENA